MQQSFSLKEFFELERFLSKDCTSVPINGGGAGEIYKKTKKEVVKVVYNSEIEQIVNILYLYLYISICIYTFRATNM